MHRLKRKLAVKCNSQGWAKRSLKAVLLKMRWNHVFVPVVLGTVDYMIVNY